MIFVICISTVILHVYKGTEELFLARSDDVFGRNLPIFHRDMLHQRGMQHVHLKHHNISTRLHYILLSQW